MFHRLLGYLFAIIAVLCTASPGLAQQRAALIFGADAYEKIRPLDNATEDAAAMADLLRGLGFAVTLELDRSLKQMRQALSQFEADHTGADVALIYYAGHGVEIGGANLLLPVDIPAESLEALTAGALPLDELRAVATRMAPAALIIVDACRDDPFGTTTEAAARSGARLVEADKAKVRLGMGRMGEARNTLFIFAAAPGMVALDGTEGHSPFTTALTRYFGTPGVEVRSALTLVQQEVYDKTAGRQLPYMESALPALLYVAAETGPELAERDRLLMAMAGMDPAIRLEVEALAAERDMPLAPLYGAVIAAGLDQADPATRKAQLSEAADSYLAIQELIRTFSASDPEVKALHAAAQERLSVGAFGEAMELARRAQEIDMAALTGIDQIRIERTVSAAGSARLVAGIALTQLDYPAAIAAFKQAEALYGGIALLDLPEEAENDRVWTPFDLAQIHEKAGEVDQAIGAYVRMEAAIDQWLVKSPANALALRARAVAFGSRGAQLTRRGDLDLVRQLYEQSSALLFKLLADDPNNPKLLRDLMVSEVRLGDLLSAARDFDGAEQRYRSAIDQADFALAREPDSLVALSDASGIRARLGDVLLLEREDPDAAEALYLEGYRLVERREQLAPGKSETALDMLLMKTKLGGLALARGDPTAALDWYIGAETIARDLLARDPGFVIHQEYLAHVLSVKVDTLLELGEMDQALALLEEATSLSAALVDAEPRDVARLRRLLTLHLRYVVNQIEPTLHLRAAIDLLHRMEALGASDPSERLALEDYLVALDPSYVRKVAPEGTPPPARPQAPPAGPKSDASGPATPRGSDEVAARPGKPRRGAAQADPSPRPQPVTGPAEKGRAAPAAQPPARAEPAPDPIDPSRRRRPAASR